jgi:hypothetical protein
MPLLTTIPFIFDKPINVWMGLILLMAVLFQTVTGIYLKNGIFKLRRYHLANAVIILIAILVHAYYGIGYWFFGFNYGG